MEVRTRIKKALEASGKKQADLARSIGISRQNLSAYLVGKYQSTSVLPKIATALGVPLAWLTTGAPDLAPTWAKSGAFASQPPAIESPAHTFPVCGTVTAGHGWSRADDEDAPLRVRPGLQAVRVRGHSAEPLVLDGQYVLADPAVTGERLQVDDLVVVQTADGQAFCKRYAGIHGGMLFLASVHEGRGNAVIPADQAIAWQVVGVLFQEALR